MASRPLTPEEISDRVTWWQVELGLEDWVFTVICEPGRERHAAHCSRWNPEYRTAEIYIDPERVDRWELDATIVHEAAAHPIIWEVAQVAEVMAGKNRRLKALVQRAEEGAATMLEKLILKLRAPLP